MGCTYWTVLYFPISKVHCPMNTGSLLFTTLHCLRLMDCHCNKDIPKKDVLRVLQREQGEEKMSQVALAARYCS